MNHPNTHTLNHLHSYHTHLNILSLSLDPLVVPQLNDPIEPNKTYHQLYIRHIHFVIDHLDPNDPLSIY